MDKKKGHRQLIKLVSPENPGVYYITEKNKINTPESLKMKKYDKVARKMLTFVEKSKLK